MTQRADARIAGVAYISYIVFAMSSGIVYGRAAAGADVAQKLANLAQNIMAVRVTVLLDLLQIVCALTLAVTLYRLTRPVDATLALLAMAFRFGEGLLVFPLLGKLEFMQLAATPDLHAIYGDGAGTLAQSILNRPGAGFSEFCFVVGGFLFACLFLRGRLIPRWLAWIGVLTIGVQFVCVPLQIAGFLAGSVVNLLWLPILAYEVPLGFWLILKGVATPASRPAVALPA